MGAKQLPFFVYSSLKICVKKFLFVKTFNYICSIRLNKYNKNNLIIMGVFKEEANVLETVARKQKRIYTDAADFGYPYDENNPPKDIRDLIKVVKDFQSRDKTDHELPFVRNRQQWKDGVSLDIVIFWEIDEGYYMGTKYSISFNRVKKHPSLIDKSANAFISVDIEPYREKVGRRR